MPSHRQQLGLNPTARSFGTRPHPIARGNETKLLSFCFLAPAATRQPSIANPFNGKHLQTVDRGISHIPPAQIPRVSHSKCGTSESSAKRKSLHHNDLHSHRQDLAQSKPIKLRAPRSFASRTSIFRRLIPRPAPLLACLISFPTKNLKIFSQPLAVWEPIFHSSSCQIVIARANP